VKSKKNLSRESPRAQYSAAAPALEANRRYSINDGAAILNCSRSRFYEHIKAGRIRIIKDGRRSYAPGSDLIALSTIAEDAQ
jgi:hypothetical protein